MRVRGFVQDDAHIFCTEEQIQAESADFIRLTQRFITIFGFDDIELKLSTRPEQRVGSDDQWDRAEKALADALIQPVWLTSCNPVKERFMARRLSFHCATA